ncbi:MAG: RHS repeat-associated core domain-containing protein [Phycisphaerales bacterium JB060]
MASTMGAIHRIAEGDGTDAEYLIYDDRWRLISRHDGTDYLEETLYHHAGLDGYGGASDVDSVLMRRTFLSTGSPQTEDERCSVLQNWRQDAVAIIDEAAVQRERVHYSPYGRVFGMVAGDTDFDGHYGTGDSTTISNWSTDPYRAYADVDLDGDVDATDAGYSTNDNMGWDVLSRDGSTVGYAGYTQDDFIPTVNHVRYRVYKSDLGRWVQRDPAGYVDGANLYEYVMSSPIKMRDPMGLASGVGLGQAVGCEATNSASSYVVVSERASTTTAISYSCGTRSSDAGISVGCGGASDPDVEVTIQPVRPALCDYCLGENGEYFKEDKVVWSPGIEKTICRSCVVNRIPLKCAPVIWCWDKCKKCIGEAKFKCVRSKVTGCLYWKYQGKWRGHCDPSKCGGTCCCLDKGLYLK